MVNTYFSIPNIQKENINGPSEYSLESELISKRKIFITGEINQNTLNKFIMEFLYLKEENKSIDIYINSPGGEVNAGLAIYDLIQQCKCEVNIYCIGMAYSIAAVIYIGCKNKGIRYIYEHSQIMIHEPLIAGNIKGSATDIVETSKNITKVKTTINEIIAKNTKHTLDEINQITMNDSYFNSTEAIEFGISDKIIKNN